MATQTKRKQLYWEDVRVGQELSSFSMSLDANRMVRQVSGSQDWHPAHHDKGFITQWGYPDIFYNARFKQGLLGRLVQDWMGDEGFLRFLRFEMRRTDHNGDTITCKGRVTRKEIRNGQACVDCEVWIENQRIGISTPGSATVVLPLRRVARKRLP